VLERLSREVRRVSRVDSYWAAIQCTALWSCTDRTTVTAPAPPAINNRLNVFASMVGLAERTGWRGRLHSHMGRKASARFIAKRDRTALADLALQFGHLFLHEDGGTGAPRERALSTKPAFLPRMPSDTLRSL
jgi:hypothetical protein